MTTWWRRLRRARRTEAREPLVRGIVRLGFRDGSQLQLATEDPHLPVLLAAADVLLGAPTGQGTGAFRR